MKLLLKDGAANGIESDSSIYCTFQTSKLFHNILKNWSFQTE